MTAILRFIGILNIAIWIGSAVFMTFGVTSAIFSDPVERLLKGFYMMYAGFIAQLAFSKFFTLQTVCAIIALLHLLAMWLYSGRPLQRINAFLVGGLLVFSLLAAVVVQPKIRQLHLAKYNPSATLEQRDAADRSLRNWHRVAPVMQILVMAGLVFYLWRLNNPGDSPRFISASKFRG